MRNRIVVTAVALLLGTAQDGAAQVQRFIHQWEGPGANAVGFITLDMALVLNPGTSSSDETNPYVTDFELRVTGAFSGNGTFSFADYDGLDVPFGPGFIQLDTGPDALDFTRELVGQPSGDGTWASQVDGEGNFGLFRDVGTVAPAIAGRFQVVTHGGSDLLGVTSFRPALCGDTPVGPLDCRAAVGSRIVIKDTDKADSLKWQWTGDGFEQADLGDPAAGSTYYSLCIYDETTTVPTLAAELGINRGEGWTDESPRGLEYAHDGSSFGVTRARIRVAADTRTSVKVQAGTEVLALPAPVGSEFFDQDASVTVQLVSSDGACWSSSYSAADTSRNEAGLFKARAQ